MYYRWKVLKPEECFATVSAAIKRLLDSKSTKNWSPAEVRNYFNGYDKPSLSFLIDFVCPGKGNHKFSFATYADFRKRPLHPELVDYAGFDAYYALRAFGFLSLKVS